MVNVIIWLMRSIFSEIFRSNVPFYSQSNNQSILLMLYHGVNVISLSWSQIYNIIVLTMISVSNSNRTSYQESVQSKTDAYIKAQMEWTVWYKHRMALFFVIVYSIIKYGACWIKPVWFNYCVYISVFRRLWLIPQY